MQVTSEIDRMLRAHGFTLVRQNSHKIWACPCGRHRVTAQCTKPKGRGIITVTTTMRRTLRECAKEKTA